MAIFFLMNFYFHPQKCVNHCLRSFIVVVKQYDKKQIEGEKTYFILQFVLHHPGKSGEELRPEPGGSN